MKKLIIIVSLAIPMIALMAFKSGEGDKKTEPIVIAQDNEDELVDCLVKYKSKWGENNCSQCGLSSPDSYVVYVKNTCSKKIDVMIGVQEESKWWRLSTFYGVNSSDTIRVYACKGTGKWLKWAREANDKSFAFPSQQEVNEQYK